MGFSRAGLDAGIEPEVKFRVMKDPSPQGGKGSESKPGGRSEGVPAPAVRRLSLYLRELEAMLRKNRETVSSKDLGETLGYTDAQIRKDLAHFGQFGHPGVGYRVDELIAHIRSILGTDRTWRAVVVGAGNLGRALASYRGFGKRGFEVVAIFDSDAAKVGTTLPGEPPMEILSLDRLNEVIAETQAELGICAAPVDAAQQVADDLVAAGVKGILNFAPISLATPGHIPVASVELAVHLEQLAYRVHQYEASRDTEIQPES